MRGAARRQVVDKVAAAVILQSWLDARRRADAPMSDRRRAGPRAGGPAARRRATSATRAASTTSTRSTQLDTLDWTTDPWDDADAAGTVERLRWQTRSVKWVAYTLLVVVIVLILVRRPGRVVVHPPDQPAG